MAMSGDDLPPLLRGASDDAAFAKLRKRIITDVRDAIDRYGMAVKGDRRPACLSGGMDSCTLLVVLTELQWRGLLPVDLPACSLDQGQPGFASTVPPEFRTRMQVPRRIKLRATYAAVTAKIPAGGAFCALCSRLRRGDLVSQRARRRLLDRRSGPSPRRHAGDVPSEPLPRRASRLDAAAAFER